MNIRNTRHPQGLLDVGRRERDEVDLVAGIVHHRAVVVARHAALQARVARRARRDAERAAEGRAVVITRQDRQVGPRASRRWSTACALVM